MLGCDTVEDRPQTWSFVHAAIIEPSCATASCHSTVNALAGLDLSTRTSAYTMFLGRTCDAPPHAGEPAGWYVVPGDPGSRLLELLRGTGGDGLIMPLDEPLPAVEIELVERWILAGAACD